MTTMNVHWLYWQTITFELQLLDSARVAVSELGITGPDLDRVARSYAAEMIGAAVRDVGARSGAHAASCYLAPSCPVCCVMN